MYHLSSSSLRNLLTTGDPISAQSHEFEGPKSKIKPFFDEDDDCVDEEEESSLLVSVSDTIWHFEAECGSMVGLLSVALSALVSDFVQQRGKKELLLPTLEFEEYKVILLGFIDTHDGIKDFVFVGLWKLEIDKVL